MNCYINGNYAVTELGGGGIKKRALRGGENFQPKFPDSIDLKITNSCSRGCPFCHEKSVPGGKSFNLQRTIGILSTLPRVGIEIAVGGGNIFDIPNEAAELLTWMTDYGFRPRITIAYDDLVENANYVDEYRFSTGNIPPQAVIFKNSPFIGVSIGKYYDKLDIPYYGMNEPIVWHVIVGVMPVEDMRKILNDCKYHKILILGFKNFGRAVGQTPKELEEWKILGKEIAQRRFIKTIGFDNLALEQLEIKDHIDTKTWDSLWFGPEFCTSMYIDAVEETFAPTSRSIDRMSWNDITLLDYFNKYRNVFSD